MLLFPITWFLMLNNINCLTQLLKGLSDEILTPKIVQKKILLKLLKLRLLKLLKLKLTMSYIYVIKSKTSRHFFKL